MAVQEQTPYVEYVANGVTTSFALEFDCDNQDHLIVLVDDVEPVVGAWSLSNGAVVFNTAPENGKKITLQRNTPFSRTTDYQSYNNSFRPPAVNNDFDRVWYKIQELGVKDWLLDLKIQKFRDDVNLTALENTLEEARQIRDDTANSVVEVQSNVAQSQTLLENTTVQANLAQGYASSANSANAAAQQAVIDVSTAEADVYSALSAQQIAVNNSLTAIAGGHKAYQTLAAAQAAQASLPANTVVEVTNDPTSSNNGTYQWNGTTLTKSAYDPLTQAKAYTDQAGAAAASDATTKANAAEANAKSYADNATEPKLLSGTDIYYQAKDKPARLFQAIWQEYNKPVWYIGNSTFVDTTGATISLVEPEFVFTIKLTEANQTFVYPTRPTGTQTINANIDWGDGIVTNHTNYNISHSYVGAIGAEFQIKLKGVMPEFDFASGNARRTSRLMIKSIDKNTMSKVMTLFDLSGCTNLAYLCRGAYSSWINTSVFRPNYVANSPNVVFHPKAFEGLESVTNISNMFAAAGQTNNFNIPAGLLDPFVNVTSAVGLFQGLAKPLPTGILDKLVNLEDVSSMFYSTSITSLDNRIFKNQTKLKNVSQCFRLSSTLVADAFQLYTDMNQGVPTTVNGCFLTVGAMTNLASVPAAWKTL